jgi:hypothetical protein
VTRDEVRAWVRETRARQGLPPTVTDPATLAELAVLVVESMSARGGDADDEAA